MMLTLIKNLNRSTLSKIVNLSLLPKNACTYSTLQTKHIKKSNLSIISALKAEYTQYHKVYDQCQNNLFKQKFQSESEKLIAKHMEWLSQIKQFKNNNLLDSIFLHRIKRIQTVGNPQYNQAVLNEDLILKIEGNIQIIEDLNHKQMSAARLASATTLFKHIIQYIQLRLPTKNSAKRHQTIIQCAIKSAETLSFFSSYGLPFQDLLPNNTLSCDEFWDNIQMVQVKASQTRILRQYTVMQALMHIIAGGVAQTQQSSISFVYAGKLLLSWACLSLQYRKAYSKSLQIHFTRNFQKMLAQVNLIDSDIFGYFFDITLPRIATNMMIYVPTHETQEQSFDIFKYTPNAIPVRILYYDRLPLANQIQLQPKGANKIEDIMIHMHGGGFVAFTSRATQPYSRIWAKSTKIPIFSIDYSLAPAHPFPQAVQDCWKVYNFIVKNIHKYFKINPKNIYLGGDSAGGNLCCGLTAKILQNKMQIPKGLFLVYPSLDMRRVFYGSRKEIMNEPLLWPSLINLAFQAYFKNHEDCQSPIASPLLLTEQFITGQKGNKSFPRLWPKTQMMVGGADALRDECLLFMQRMKEAKIECRCTIVSNLKHGFLSTEQVLLSTKGVVEYSSLLLKRLIDAQQSQK